MWTLSSLQMHQHAMIVVDEDATLELQVKTVKVRVLSLPLGASADILQYFKSIEQVATSQGFGQALASEALTLKKRDSVLEKLESPRNPTSKSFLAPTKPDLTRQITQELIPDSMHARLPEQPADRIGLDGLEAKDVPLSASES